MLKQLLAIAVGIGIFCLLYNALITPSVAHAVDPAIAPLRFVDEQGTPLATLALRLLCYNAADAAAPLHDLLLETQTDGSLSQTLPSDCLYLAALHQLYQQPASKAGRQHAYTIYDTSWQPGTRALLPASGDITLHSDWRLLLFDVQISLEWSAAADSDILAQLRSGMQAASAYLYDLSDGQMAFGDLILLSGGQGWESADIRMRAANDARPAARVGGIVGERIAYTTTTGIQTIFAPGEILTGRAWNGESAASGDWSEPAAYRTLVHEWLHYALFLYDEYQTLVPQGRQESYCTCNDLPKIAGDPSLCDGLGSGLAASAMAYHYSASELWLSGLPASCRATDQNLVHGESDWQTVAHWSALQGLPAEWLYVPASLVSGPTLGLAADLLGRQPTQLTSKQIFLPLISRNAGNPLAQQGKQLEERRDLTITILISDAQFDLAALNQYQLQIYTLQPAQGATPARILHQGSTSGSRLSPNHLGELPLLGVQAGDQVVVNASRYAPGDASFADLHFAGTLDPGQKTISLTVNPWPVTLEVTPTLHDGRFDALTLNLSSTLDLPQAPTLRLCSPDAAIGCASDWQSTFQKRADQSWQATWRASAGEELPHFGYLWIDAPGRGSLIRWFQAAGGVGPAHMFGEAPLRDGLLTLDAAQPITGASGVLILPATQDLTRQAPLPPGSQGLIGFPLTVKVASSTANAAFVPTLFYGNDTLERLGANAQSTHLLRFDPSTGQWLPVPAIRSSLTLGWIAAPPQPSLELLALAWSSQPNIGQLPNLLVDEGEVNNAARVRSLVVLPAASSVPPSATGHISYVLPAQLTPLTPPRCTIGECFYDDATHTLVWQGTFGASRGVVLSSEARLEIAITCNPTLQHNAAVFDGQQWRILQATTQVACPTPLATPTGTATPTPSATATITMLPNVTATETIAITPKVAATEAITATPNQTPTLTDTKTPTLTPTWTSVATNAPTAPVCLSAANEGEAATAVCTPVDLP